MQPYNGPDRRTPAETLSQEHLELLIETRVNQHFDAAVDGLKEHISKEMEAQKAFIKTAFPDGDMQSHNLAHKEMNKLAADRAERWNKLWDRILVGGGYSLAAAIALALWEAFKDNLRK